MTLADRISALASYVAKQIVKERSAVASSLYTSDRILALADVGAVAEMSGTSALNVTVPPSSATPLPLGGVLQIYQLGAGQVTLVAGSGVQFRPPNVTFKTRAQGSSMFLRQRAVDDWTVEGDLA